MKLKVLLTVDLHNADSSKRDAFDEAMGKKKWKKLKDVTTTYKASFEEGVSAGVAIETTKKDVKNAAKEAGISEYDAACLASDQDVTAFSS